MTEGRVHYIYPENSINKYAYVEIQVNNRDSLAELGFDSNIRHRFWHIHSGDIVIDVGAGFGGYTLCALARDAKFVHAFENNPTIVRCLRANLHQNAKENAMERTSVSTWRVDDKNYSIDKYVESRSFEIGRVSWIKIDTGSIEENIQVLHGARKTIAKFKPNVLINAPSETAAGLSEYGKILYNEEAGHRLIVFER